MPLSAKRAQALAAAAASAFLLLSVLPVSANAAEGECPNEALRVGFSAHLPDCRAYEVVSPDTGALPLATLIGTEDVANNMDTWFASPDGESVIFDTNGSIEGENDNGHSDRYESIRTLQGWKMRFQAASGEQSQGASKVGGASPDHRLSFIRVGIGSEGTLPLGNYLYERGGNLSPLGTGSLGTDPNAEGLWMTEGGAHVLFTTAPPHPVIGNSPPVQLEPDAPPAPAGAIYDRPLGGPTSVVSLLPGDATPLSDARYLGSSPDASAVAFEVNGTIFVRRGGTTTQAAAYPEPGEQLHCNAPQTFGEKSRQWLRDGMPIAGATGADYLLQPADAGHAIQCEVTATGSSVGVSAPPTLVTTTEDPVEPPQQRGPIPAAGPADPTAGTLETCAAGQWSGSPAFSYQWYANGEAIPGASSQTYEVQAADVPSSLQCAISATNADGTVLAFSQAQQTSPPPAAPAGVPVVDVNDPALSFSGVSPGGARTFSSRGKVIGEEDPYEGLEAFDATTGNTTVIAEGGSVWPVNVSEDGSHAYFISTEALTGTEANSVGANAVAGEDNLYVWNGSAVRYVATVIPRDISAVKEPHEVSSIMYGLGRWNAGFTGGFGLDPSRTTPDGSVFAFQSYANLLPGYDSQGHSEVFRYDALSGELTCVSCNPEGTPATSESELQTISPNISERIGVNTFSHIPNITPDGKTVVFETPERLLPTQDEDDFYDVYRWSEGELALISSGQSSGDDFLFGMSADAHDIFFQTHDSLVPQDQDGGVRSIYDAREGGGFPPPLSGPVCEGEGCQGGPAPAPGIPVAATPGFHGAGNVPEAPHRKKHRHKKKRHRHANQHAHKAKGGKR